jgi:hypothetical protein
MAASISSAARLARSSGVRAAPARRTMVVMVSVGRKSAGYFRRF